MADGPIMVRAAITRPEWDELRKVAIDRNASTAELVARALREMYPAITATREDEA